MATDTDLIGPAVDDEEEIDPRYPAVRAGAGFGPRAMSLAPILGASGAPQTENLQPPVSRSARFAAPAPLDDGSFAQPPVQSGAPLAPTSSGPSAERDALTGALAEPNRADYAPPVRHGFFRKLEDFAERSPIGQIGREAWGLPATRQLAGDQRYQQDEAQYNRLIGRGAAEEKAEQDAEDATSKRDLEAAQANAANADAYAKKNPQPKEGTTAEDTTIHDLMTGANGQPRTNPDTGKPYTYLDAYTAVKKAGAAPAKQDEEDKAVSDWLSANNLPDTAANRTKARTAIKESGETGTWTLGRDENNKPIEINSKSGTVRDAPRGAQKGPGAKGGANEKDALGAQQKATAAIGALNQQLAQGKIQEPAYVDQSIAEWKNVAQAARAAGETPTGTQDLAVLYLKKYGSRDAAIKAMTADGWQVQ